ncbi:MAG: terpene cyclase/mutase family protein [Planctomycetota bacterium]|nr:terpene cyclase/mutase family protein [Planctomycetota bacterium]
MYCQEELTQTKELIQHLKEVSEEPLLRDLAPEILKKIPQGVWMTSNRRVNLMRTHIFFMVGAVACILLILFSLWLEFPKNGKRPERNHLSNNPLDEKMEELLLKSNAITDAIDWLVKTQEPSGFWDAKKWGGHKDYTVGLTALSLLALLNSGKDSDATQSIIAVERAVKYLIKQQSDEGYFGPQCGRTMYNHGIATVALLEYYGISKDERLIKPLDRAIKYICTTQKKNGGWGYVDGKENTSISVWPLLALGLAQKMGCRSIQENLEKGIAWIKSMFDEKGYAGYSQRGDFPLGPETLTSMASFLISLYSDEKADSHGCEIDSGVKQSLEQIAAREDSNINYYRWYFLIQALSTCDTQSDKWIDSLQKELIKSQVKKGEHSGSWDPNDCWGSVGGRVYATALATLSLQLKEGAQIRPIR